MQNTNQIKPTNNVVSVLDNISFDLQKKFLESPDIQIIPNHSKQLTKEEITTSVRFFEIEKFVYEKDIKISDKLKAVFSALHSVKANLIMQINSDGKECKINIGVKADEKITDKANVLKGALQGNFPGTNFTNKAPLSNDKVIELNNSTFSNPKEVTAVVGIPSLKDEQEEKFTQGIENLIIGMNGKEFSAVFIANHVKTEEVDFAIDTYEQIYSVLSSDKEFVVTDGTNSSESISNSTSNSTSNSNSTSSSNSTSNSKSNSKSNTEGTNKSKTNNKSPWFGKKVWISIVGGKTVGNSTGTSHSETESDSISESQSNSITESKTNSISESQSKSLSNTSGSSSSHQKTFTNKKVSNFLDQLDEQIQRLQQGRGIGFWNVGAYFLSEKSDNSIIAANIYNGIIKGEKSNFETSVVKTYNDNQKLNKDNIINYLQRYELPILDNGNYLAQAVNTNELTVQFNLPHKSIIGLEVVEITPFGNNIKKQKNNTIKVGSLYNYEQQFENEILLDYNKFTSHIFVTGSTGSGKSNVTYNLIQKLYEENIKFLVIEPAKGEYKNEFGNRKDVFVYGTNSKETNLLKINPFVFPENIHIYEHIDRFIEILNVCWPMEAAMPNILKEAIEDAYLKKGWLLDESICIHDKNVYPTFLDLLKALEDVIKKSKFSQEIKSNYEGALVSRVRSLTNGLNKLIFTDDCLSDTELFDSNVIIDLSRVASSEGKALFMGIIFMKLNEYRLATKTSSNSPLKHITVIEEAHNLLKRTSSEQSSSSVNLLGKSVEMISNAIAEMRTYGEGFIIADQAPGLLDMSVIRNTNTKICLRLPDYSDRELVGHAMNLNNEQIKELAKLETGVAAIYQNDWHEAILCKFDKFESKEEVFKHIYSPNNKKEINIALALIEQTNLNKVEKLYIEKYIPIHFILNSHIKNGSKKIKEILLLKTIQKTTSLDLHQAKVILKYIITKYK